MRGRRAWLRTERGAVVRDNLGQAKPEADHEACIWLDSQRAWRENGPRVNRERAHREVMRTGQGLDPTRGLRQILFDSCIEAGAGAAPSPSSCRAMQGHCKL